MSCREVHSRDIRQEYGRQLLRWVPMMPASWHSCSCTILSNWLWAGPSDLLLLNRVWQKWWAVTLETGLQNNTALCPICPLLLSNLIFLIIARCHFWANLWRGAYDKKLPVNFHKHMSELANRSSPTHTLRWLQTQTYLNCTQILYTQKLRILNIFKATKFWYNQLHTIDSEYWDNPFSIYPILAQIITISPQEWLYQTGARWKILGTSQSSNKNSLKNCLQRAMKGYGKNTNDDETLKASLIG